MRSDLSRITSGSTALARDMRLLGSRLNSANESAIRGLGVRLRRDASRLGALTGHRAAALRALSRRERSPARRRYFDLILATLEGQWAEGQALTRLADLVWWDPLLLDGRDAHRLWQLNRDAEWYAWMSVESARAAQTWRVHHHASFRYVPVHPPAHVATGPYL